MAAATPDDDDVQASGSRRPTNRMVKLAKRSGLLSERIFVSPLAYESWWCSSSMAVVECGDESPESAMVATYGGGGPTVGRRGVEHAQERLIQVQQQPAGILSSPSSGMV
uniref:Uncharacterized protein n=1 Tax=Oryza glumipatula TaxID=40148 RepID=A0A0D9ZJD9_9ORYZ